MHRRTVSVAVLLAAVLGPVVPARAEGPPALRATLEACTTGLDPAGRTARLTGSMPAADGATRMAMRFDLERRHEPVEADVKPKWKRVRGLPGFGTWERSEPRRAGFVSRKRVSGLEAGAAYRAVVRFRWSSETGRVERRARRVTTVCRQPDLRPDLSPGELTLRRTPVGVRYSLVVRNSGRSAAGPFGVQIAGMSTTVAGLAPGAAQAVSVDGPVCVPGTRVQVVVDADAAVDEIREDDGVAARICTL